MSKIIRPSIPIGIQPGTKLLRIERHTRRSRTIWASPTAQQPTNTECVVEVEGSWLIWINANIDFTCGTCIVLHDDGRIESVRIEPDGTEERFWIKAKGD